VGIDAYKVRIFFSRLDSVWTKNLSEIQSEV